MCVCVCVCVYNKYLCHVFNYKSCTLFVLNRVHCLSNYTLCIE